MRPGQYLSIIAIVLINAVSEPLFAQVDSLWSHAYHGRNFDENPSIIQMIDGGFAISGGTGASNGGNICGFLVKTDKQGNELWSREYAEIDIFKAVIQSPDGGLILGGHCKHTEEQKGGMCLVKTDEKGEKLWMRLFGRASCESVISTADGGYALAGSIREPRTTISHFSLVKTDSDGLEEWSNTYPEAGIGSCLAIIQTEDGGFALAGITTKPSSPGVSRREDFFLVRTDKQGNFLWSKTYPFEGYYNNRCKSLVQTADGGFALAGECNPNTNVSKGDMFMVKTDSNGNALWSINYGGENHEEGASILLMADGGFMLAGMTSSINVNKKGRPVNEYYMVRTDFEGVELWSRTFGGIGFSHCKSIIHTSDGGFALVGTTTEFGTGGLDFWLVKTGPEIFRK